MSARRDRFFFPFAREIPVVVAPGLDDSGPGHWQTLWQSAHPSFLRVQQSDYANPDLDAWADALSELVRTLPMPPIVVGHSFGCLATVRAAHRDRLALTGAMLVAPADPERFGIVGSQLPGGRLPYTSVLVASTNDPWLRFTRAGRLAQLWGSRFVGIEGGGHLNADSGLGAWPRGIALLRELAERAASSGSIAPAARGSSATEAAAA